MKEQYSFSFLGKAARIIRHKRVNGGQSDFKVDRCPSLIIEINERYPKPLFLKFLMHELFEIGAHILGCDYKSENPNKHDWFYIMHHIDLTNLCDAVQLAYETIKHGIND